MRHTAEIPMGEPKEKEPEKTFSIGRQGPHEFEVYETVKGEEDAIKMFLDTIRSISNPSEIRLYEVVGDEYKLRTDLEERAESETRTNKRLEDIGLEDKIDISTAKQLGFDLRKGTNWYDYSGQPMTLDEMAKMEASSILYARKKGMQTTVSPSNGIYVDWDDPNSKLAKDYSARVEKYIQEE